MEYIIRRRERKDCRGIARVVTESWPDAYRGIIRDEVLERLPATEEERANKALECFDKTTITSLCWKQAGRSAGL